MNSQQNEIQEDANVEWTPFVVVTLVTKKMMTTQQASLVAV